MDNDVENHMYTLQTEKHELLKTFDAQTRDPKQPSTVVYVQHFYLSFSIIKLITNIYSALPNLFGKNITDNN